MNLDIIPQPPEPPKLGKMKKFKGLIIPENLIIGNNDDCCNNTYEYGNCAYIKCNKCLINYPDKFKHWNELGRPCEICEDE